MAQVLEALAEAVHGVADYSLSIRSAGAGHRTLRTRLLTYLLTYLLLVTYLLTYLGAGAGHRTLRAVGVNASALALRTIAARLQPFLAGK